VSVGRAAKKRRRAVQQTRDEHDAREQNKGVRAALTIRGRLPRPTSLRQGRNSVSGQHQSLRNASRCYAPARENHEHRQAGNQAHRPGNRLSQFPPALERLTR